MHFHVLTLFPDMITQGLNTSITGRSIESGTITLNAVNIRDYTVNKHKKAYRIDMPFTFLRNILKRVIVLDIGGCYTISYEIYIDKNNDLFFLNILKFPFCIDSLHISKYLSYSFCDVPFFTSYGLV